MFKRTQFQLALVLTLAVSSVTAGSALVMVRAEQQPPTPAGAGANLLPQQQPANRPRRADEPATTAANTSQQQTTTPLPTPTATPSAADEVTLPEDEVVRVDTTLTNVLLSAIDKSKRFVTTLKKEDVRVLEDGVPQEIFTFNQQVDLPLTLAIVIDTSISQERTLPDEKAAARAFVDAVLRPGKDEVAVVSFTGDTQLEQGLTGSVQRVRRAIDQVEFVPPSGYIGNGQIVPTTPPISGDNQSRAGSTAIWDAIYVTSNEVLSESSDKTRRALILVSDGFDTSSQLKLNEAVERSIKNDVMVYSIGIGDSYYGGVEEGTLRKLSERTGGRAYFPKSEADLRNAFAQIQKDLREQYLVAYSPTNKARDGSFRQLKVEIINPELKKQNLRLIYREGYFAKSDSARRP